jgi:hypothetical protein
MDTNWGGAIEPQRTQRTQITGRKKAQEAQNISPAKQPTEESFKKLKR